MKKQIISVFFLTAMSSCFAVSFDCTQTKKTALQLICQSPELSGLDDELMGYYQSLRAKAGEWGVAEQSIFQNLAKEGLKSRDACQNEACLIQWYHRYIDIYAQAGNAFKQTEQKKTTQTTLPFTYPNTTHEIDEEATAKARWPIGHVLATGTAHWPIYYGKPIYRKFLGITKDGYFLVQAFYKEGDKKLTDPYVLTSLGEVTSHYIGNEDHITGEYVLWYFNGQKWSESEYIDGNPYGIDRLWNEDGTLSREVDFGARFIK